MSDQEKLRQLATNSNLTEDEIQLARKQAEWFARAERYRWTRIGWGDPKSTAKAIWPAWRGDS
jgi:hypothetical protein